MKNNFCKSLPIPITFVISFILLISLKGDYLNAEYLFKTKGPSKKITEKKGMKDCESKYNEGCYIHYSSRLAFGS